MTDKDIIGYDKLMHFCVCLVLSFYSTELAVGAALGKEYGDSKAEGNHWCWWDIAADALGIVLGTLIRVLTISRYNWF